MDMLDNILDWYSEDEFIKADGFDEAIIGVDYHNARLIYSVSKCIKILEKDIPEEEASEYFFYNVAGAYVGEKTPIWCQDDF